MIVRSPTDPRTTEGRSGGGNAERSVLLIEADPVDAQAFQALVSDADAHLSIRIADSLEAGLEEGRRDPPSCVVVDLALPDHDDLDALVAVRDALPELPVVVLTGWAGEGLGSRALQAGAQDYLIKGQENGGSIARAVRFAIERKRAEIAAAALAVAATREREQRRLERHLIATPVLRSAGLRLAGRYVVSRDGLIGGDFSDCVELEDGTIRMVIGDVAGHGTDEAALGVALRIGWRTLALTSPPDADTLPGLEAVLQSERAAPDIFATVCEITIDAPRRRLTVRSAGHPPPILSDGRIVHDQRRRPPLGIDVGDRRWEGTTVDIECPIEVTLYTDGLYEVRGETGSILTLEDVVDIIVRNPGTEPGALARLLSEIESLAVTGWRDDVALARLAIATSG